MLNLVLIALVALSVFLAQGWFGVRAENVQLKRTIASLKRQIERRK